MDSDIELTKKCADAMGIRLCDGYDTPRTLYTNDDSRSTRGFEVPYQPLKDDAQAMALVRQFKLSIYQHQDVVTVTAFFHDGQKVERRIDDLNRAIVQCVAALKQPRAKRLA